MNTKYILKGKKAVPVEDALEWGNWFETADKERVVKQQTLKSGMWISTVFLGLDHNFGGGKPLLFETMVFDTNDKKKYKIGDNEHESIGEEMETNRYSTWEEAEAGHKKLVKKWNDKADRKKRKSVA